MEQNPFIYGSEVSGEQFWGREEELRTLKLDISNSQNVVLYSNRRMGKTSLVKEVVRNLSKEKFITVYVDLYPTNSIEDFVGRYASAVMRSIRGPMDKVLVEIRSILRSFTPSVTIDDDGKPVFSLDILKNAKEEQLLEEVLESFFVYCKTKKKLGVVVLDEFQQIGVYDKNRKLEATLRSHFQSHNNISYIFLGSKKHLLMEIFSSPNRPFYHSSKMFPLGEIDLKTTIECVQQRFKKSKCKIDDDVAEYLVVQAENNPYYTQRLAHSVWNKMVTKGTAVKKRDVDDIFQNIVNENSDYFRSLCELLTANQLKALKTAAHIKNGEKIFSGNFLNIHGWQKDSLKQTLDALVEKDMINREGGAYKIDDVFFRRWLVDNS